MAGGTPRYWGEWSVSACSETCGEGTVTWTRDCLGDCGTCEGDATATQTCTGGPWLRREGSVGMSGVSDLILLSLVTPTVLDE